MYGGSTKSFEIQSGVCTSESPEYALFVSHCKSTNHAFDSDPHLHVFLRKSAEFCTFLKILPHKLSVQVSVNLPGGT